LAVLSCMDAPENARVLERNKRIRIAVMYAACLRYPVTTGLDGIRLSKGLRRDAQSTYRVGDSDNTSSWIYPGSLFRHNVFFTLTWPSTFFSVTQR